MTLSYFCTYLGVFMKNVNIISQIEKERVNHKINNCDQMALTADEIQEITNQSRSDHNRS